MAQKRKVEEVLDSKKPHSKRTTSGSPPKKLRKDEPSKEHRQHVKSKADVPERPRPQHASLIQEEERSFPRGGGGVLTPLEHKQIQIQATKDALFEESAQKRARDDTISDEDTADGDDDDEAAPRTAAKKKSKKSEVQRAPTDIGAEPHVRVEGLKTKRLSPGSLVLGQVSKILHNEVILDLPNSLVGHVSIAHVSPILTEKVLALGEEAGDDANSTAEDDDIDLHSLFSVGQYLRAVVISTGDEAAEKDKKRRKKIDLSLDPSLANAKLDSAAISENCMLQACVASVEDHGLVMNTGLEDGSIKGFMSSKEIPSGLELAKIQQGMVFLCLVTGLSSNRKVIKLSANHEKAGDIRKSHVLTEPLSVNTLLPGTAVELLVSQVTGTSISGKLMGTVAAGADIVHTGAAAQRTGIDTKYKIGDKVKARILFNLMDTDESMIGLSLLDHILSLNARSLLEGKTKSDPLTKVPIGTIIDNATICNVQPGLGVFTFIGTKNGTAFVHNSRLADGRADPPSAESGPFRPGTSHRARLIAYNAMDGNYLASFEKSVLDQEYLRVEDVPVGQVVKGTVEKLIFQKSGSSGVIVSLAQGISGLVPELHLADVHLQHPERKFREGLSVTARVLSTDTERHQIRLTLKKSLVSTEATLWTSYDSIKVGSESLGTILTLDAKGALMQFFGPVRGFLPVSQMSDTFTEDARSRFRVGQVVTVRALSVDPEAERMAVTCRTLTSDDATAVALPEEVKLGKFVSGQVSEITDDAIMIELKDAGVKAALPKAHMTDATGAKVDSVAKRTRVGQTLHDLLVIEVLPKRKAITLSNKPSLVATAKEGKLWSSLQDLDEGITVTGFVRNVTEEGIFLQTVGGLVGLIHRSQVPSDRLQLPDYGFTKGHSIAARVSSIDLQQQRFSLTLNPLPQEVPQQDSTARPSVPSQSLVKPVDGVSSSMDDFSIGKRTMAKITSVKDSQLNVQLADNVQGRVDVSEAFSKWEDIRDRKHPLRSFKAQDKVSVRILGIHDARNHRFLPITHRGGKVPVFELSAKPDSDTSLLSYDQLKMDEWYVAFVNNITETAMWVNLSPNVRGRIARVDVSEDVSIVSDLSASFPIGAAIKVRVKSVDVASSRLDLTAKATTSEEVLTLDNLTEGAIVTGRITKVTERALLVQLGPALVGQVGPTDLADDFDEANPDKHQKNDVVRACVLSIDRANKRVHLTTRPSKVLSSSLPVTDRQIAAVDQVKGTEVVRGFVKNVSEKGIFVALSHSVTAFVPVPELSDAFIKDWKALFEIDRLVKGKILAVDVAAKQVKMSLKESVVSGDYVPRRGFNDFQKDDIVTGKVRKVEVFGAFIVLDNTNNVSGLAHRSQVAERRVEDVTKILEPGDQVKAKILKIDPAKQQISLGLKRSYFEDVMDEDDDEEEDDDDEDTEGAAIEPIEDADSDEDELEEDEGSDDDGGVELDLDGVPDGSGSDEESDDEATGQTADESGGLDAGTFDWSGTLKPADNALPVTSSKASRTSVKSNKKTYQEDLTATLDETTTSSDFERRLLSERNIGATWIAYIQLYINQGDVDTARQIAERALKEIHIREQEEKLTVWLAFLGLEIEYGDDETVDGIFSRACEYNDAREVHLRAADAFAGSGRIGKADETFAAMLKRKDWNTDIALWLTYARFLFDTANEPERARGLLQRADQILVGTQSSKDMQAKLRRDLVMKFAQLEFKCANGDAEKGRNQFEKLVDMYPTRWDIWDVYVEMEKKVGRDESAAGGDGGQRVRDLYERMTDTKSKLKKRRATFVFKQWLKWEEVDGGNQAKKLDHVKAKAADVAERLRAEKDE